MFALISTYLTQRPIDLGSEIKGIGPLGFQGTNPCDITTFFPNIISTIIGVLTVCAILWFILNFIMGTYKWISSGGDSKAIESARSQIIQAIVGLILILVALIILSVLGNVFGLDILNVKEMLDSLYPGGAWRC